MTNAITIIATTLVNEAITVDNSLKLMALCSFNYPINRASFVMISCSTLVKLSD